MADDLQVLFPDREIVVGNETLTIRPFTARQWPQVIGVFQKLQPLLQLKDADGTVDILSIFAAGADDLYRALGIAAAKPLEWFDGVQMDDAIRLFSLVIEINQTFFVERLAPMLPDLLARFGLQPKVADGAEQSPSSSPTVTDGLTSKTTPSTRSSSSKQKAAA